MQTVLNKERRWIQGKSLTFFMRRICGPTGDRESDKTKSRITAVTCQKSSVVVMLNDVPIHFRQKIMKLSFLVLEGYLYKVIVGEPTVENISGVLDRRDRVASFL